MTRRQFVGSITIAALAGLLVMGLVFTLTDMDLPRYDRTCTQLTGRVVFNYGTGLVLWVNPDGLVIAPSYTGWFDNFGDSSQSVTAQSPDWSSAFPGADVVLQGTGCPSGWFLATAVTVLPANVSPLRLLLTPLSGISVAGLLFVLLNR